MVTIWFCLKENSQIVSFFFLCHCDNGSTSHGFVQRKTLKWCLFSFYAIVMMVVLHFPKLWNAFFHIYSLIKGIIAINL
eukprot:c9562_g1_i1 orf=67-303(-)